MALATPGVTPAAALDSLRQRVQLLRDPTAPVSLDELARQLPTLEALYHRFAADALRAGHPDHRGRLMRAAIQAQQAHARTFALLYGLAMQGRGKAAVSVDLDSDAGAGLDPDGDGDGDGDPDTNLD
jgi:hypothetical protein